MSIADCGLAVDCESFPNFFMIGTYEIGSGETRCWTSEPGLGEPLCDFPIYFRDHRQSRLWLTFNGRSYDNALLAKVLEGQTCPRYLNAISQNLIANSGRRMQMDAAGDELAIDLAAVLGGPKAGSLKELAAKVAYPNLEDLPYPYDDELDREQMAHVVAYNAKDLGVTGRIAQIVEGSILARLALATEYRVPLPLLNRHDAALAESLMGHNLFGGGRKLWPNTDTWYLHGSSLTQHFRYQTPVLQELLERIATWSFSFQRTETLEDGETQARIEYEKREDAVKLGDLILTIGCGGLHTQSGPGIYEADMDWCLLEADAVSFYPSIIARFGVVPQHLPKAVFLREYQKLRDRRVHAKQAGDVALADGLKIATNAIFGKAGAPWGWLSDPAALLTITLTGELLLLDLLDLLASVPEAVEPIMGNTDGWLLRVRRRHRDAVVAACDEWAARWGLSLEWTEFTHLWRRDVSNYYAVTVDGKDKARGAYRFEPNRLSTKPVHGVVIRAVQAFFRDGTPLAETIAGCRDLSLFLDFFACGKTYSLEAVAADGSVQKLGRVARWYLGTEAGAHIDKVRNADGQRTQQVEHGAKVVMDLPAGGPPEDIDLAAYVAMAEKLVHAITEPEVRPEKATVPIAELSKQQRSRFDMANLITDADPAAVAAAVDLERAQRDWGTRYKGGRHASMYSLLARAWTGGGGVLNRGDLAWFARYLDEEYVAQNKREVERMVAAVVRYSPFRLPQTPLEMAHRALTWAQENVELLKRRRKELPHAGVLDSVFISGDSLRKYAKLKDAHRLLCSMASVAVRHDHIITPERLCELLAEVDDYLAHLEARNP